jgi:rare lipoprotein A
MRQAPIPVVLALAAMLPFAPALANDAPNGGQPQRGQASYYDPDRFAGRPMANGDRFDPQSNAAAHRTLPLGTVADVTNLDTGETRRVVIEDRGPYVRRPRDRRHPAHGR